MKHLACLLALLGCGPSWTSTDAKSTTDIANAALSLEAVCDRDSGVCPASAVRAIERGTYCAAGATLSRHHDPIPDGGGVACQR